jgi:phosphotransferase system HPr-like phosphotransfer protein
MIYLSIKLNTIEDVYEFVRLATEYGTDVDVKQKQYTVNGKSILGVFSLDLRQPMQLVIRSGDGSQFEQFKA